MESLQDALKKAFAKLEASLMKLYGEIPSEIESEMNDISALLKSKGEGDAPPEKVPEAPPTEPQAPETPPPPPAEVPSETPAVEAPSAPPVEAPSAPEPVAA